VHECTLCISFYCEFDSLRKYFLDTNCSCSAHKSRISYGCVSGYERVKNGLETRTEHKERVKNGLETRTEHKKTGQKRVINTSGTQKRIKNASGTPKNGSETGQKRERNVRNESETGPKHERNIENG